MNVLPFETITYSTKLEPQQVLDRIKKAVKEGRYKLVKANKLQKNYNLTNNLGEFHITRVIAYKNSFNPRIKGRVSKSNQTKVELVLSLNPSTLIFMIIWMILPFGVGVLGIAMNEPTLYLIPFGMVLFAYLTTILGFNFEANKSKKILAELIDAESNEK